MIWPINYCIEIYVLEFNFFCLLKTSIKWIVTLIRVYNAFAEVQGLTCTRMFALLVFSLCSFMCIKLGLWNISCQGGYQQLKCFLALCQMKCLWWSAESKAFAVPAHIALHKILQSLWPKQSKRQIGQQTNSDGFHKTFQFFNHCLFWGGGGVLFVFSLVWGFLLVLFHFGFEPVSTPCSWSSTPRFLNLSLLEHASTGGLALVFSCWRTSLAHL